MSPTLEALGIDRLAFEERIALAQEILDSVVAEQPIAALAEAKRRGVQRRLADHAANPTLSFVSAVNTSHDAPFPRNARKSRGWYAMFRCGVATRSPDARERTAASRAPVVSNVRSTGYGDVRVTKKCWIAFDNAMN